ncbi:thioredoxin family protein [Belliella kenyensis]|uniref:Thioredoxin family protein n=1 Tax=Belliella kenyensis TaxID=1472724 RepID=A0ABV8EJI6_9BACT|nr:thioredoxin fold domain-containing protein [Belliella kenyensis]MCH7400348.1 thioredoxin fold domain-containing protein [Belliella kenyensis]MDN3604634.1 thioredoxin fold domain-containing protein [Belliella kenyensis]
MKKISVFMLFIFGVSAAAFSQEDIKWMTFEEAAKATSSSPKMILVDVYTDWCGWCKKMDKETFTNSEVIAYVNENFYPVKLHAEKTDRKFSFKGKEYTEASMAKTMRVTSFPNFVVMDATMENITQLPGYREPKPFIEGLDGIVKRFTK